MKKQIRQPGRLILLAWCLFVFQSIVLPYVVMANDAQSTKQLAGWEIDYDSKFAGLITLKLCEKGLYLKLEKISLTIICSEPTWACHIYNDLTRRSMTMSGSRWKARFTQNVLKYRTSDPLRVKTIVTPTIQTIGGVTASKIILQKTQENGSTQLSELWIARDLSVPPQFKDLLNMALNLPKEINGTPIRVSIIEQTPYGSRSYQVLSAYKVRGTTFSPNDFEPLPGYKEVQNQSSLMVGDQAQSMK